MRYKSSAFIESSDDSSVTIRINYAKVSVSIRLKSTAVQTWSNGETANFTEKLTKKFRQIVLQTRKRSTDAFKEEMKLLKDRLDYLLLYYLRSINK